MMRTIFVFTFFVIMLFFSHAKAQNTCQEFVFQNVGPTRSCAEGFGTFVFADAPDQTFIQFNGTLGDIGATFDSSVDLPLGVPTGIVEPMTSSIELIKVGSSNKARAVMHRHTSRLELSPNGVVGLTDADAFTGSIGDLKFTPVLPDGLTGAINFDLHFSQTYTTQSPPANLSLGRTVVSGGYTVLDENEPGNFLATFGGASFNDSGAGLSFSPGFTAGAQVTTIDLGGGTFQVRVDRTETFQLDAGRAYLLDSGHSLTVDLDGIGTGSQPTWLADSRSTTEIALVPRNPRVTLFLSGVADPAPPADQLIAVTTNGKVFQIDTATRQATLLGPGPGLNIAGNVNALAFANDGSLFALRTGNDNQGNPDGELLQLDLQTGEAQSLGFIDREIGNAAGLAVDPATDTLITNVDRSPNQDLLTKIFRTGAGQAAHGDQITQTIGTLNVEGASVAGLEFDGDGVLFGIDGFNNLQTGVLQEELVRIDHLDPATVEVIGESELAPFPNIGDFTIGPSGKFWAINEDDQGRPELIEIDPTTGIGTDLGLINGLPAGVSSDAFAALPIDALLNGDFNEDGLAGGADFLDWQRGFGMGSTHLEGDGNLDGVVNSSDLAVWRLSFGSEFGTRLTGSAQSALTVVPEPAAWLCLFLGCTVSLASSRRLLNGWGGIFR